MDKLMTALHAALNENRVFYSKLTDFQRQERGKLSDPRDIRAAVQLFNELEQTRDLIDQILDEQRK